MTAYEPAQLIRVCYFLCVSCFQRMCFFFRIYFVLFIYFLNKYACKVMDTAVCAVWIFLRPLICWFTFELVKSLDLTLLHSERSKMHAILAFLSAIGLNLKKKTHRLAQCVWASDYHNLTNTSNQDLMSCLASVDSQFCLHVDSTL